jgi:hypothetical protein
MYDDDDYSYAIMMGFSDIDDLITFVEWVNDNFDSPEGLRDWFDANMDKYLGTRCTRPHSYSATGPAFDCSDCRGSFMTEAGLELHQITTHGGVTNDPFWEIINNAYTNHTEVATNDELHGPE